MQCMSRSYLMQLLHEGLERSEILYSNFPVTKLSPRGRAFCIHLALHLLGLQCAHELLQEVPLHLQNVNVSAENVPCCKMSLGAWAMTT